MNALILRAMLVLSLLTLGRTAFADPTPQRGCISTGSGYLEFDCPDIVTPGTNWRG